MNKLFSKIAALSVGLTLAIGVGVAVGGNAAKGASAAEEVFYTLDGTKTGGSAGYDSGSDITQDGITWNATGNTTMNPWRIGGKSLSKVDRAVYSKNALETTITKVELTVGSASSITVNSLNLFVASDANFSTTVETVSADFAASSTLTFSSSKEWTNCYYKFVFNVTVSGSSNKFVEFKNAKFYHDSSAPVTTKYTVSFLPGEGEGTMDSVEVEEGSTYTLPACTFAAPSGKEFAGWKLGEEIVTEIENIQDDVTVTATWAKSLYVVDALTSETTGSTGSSYADWSDVSVTSKAKYAGNSAGGNESIQLRSNNNNSGIVSTTSGGTIKKVVLVWNSNTSSGRKVDVYGTNTGYSSAANLYSSTAQGSLLGSIVYGTSTELTITDSYKYVGLRSNNGALYLTQVSFYWEESSKQTIELEANGFTMNFGDPDVTPVVKIKNTETTVDNCVFVSGNESVATIVDGKVHAVGKGTATITASHLDDEQYTYTPATFDVTVTKVSSIQSLYSTSLNTSVETYGYYAGTFADGIIIMDGEYGMIVYKAAPEESWEVDVTPLHVVGTLTSYKNLYEIKDATVTLETDATRLASLNKPVNYSLTGSESTEDLTIANRRTFVSGKLTSLAYGSGGYNLVIGGFALYLKDADNVEITLKDETKITIYNYLNNNLNKNVTVKGFTNFFTNFQVRVYDIVEQDDSYKVEQFAQQILDETDVVCSDWDGKFSNKEALTEIWNHLGGEERWQALSEEEQAKFTDANANYKNESTDVVENAAGRYDMLCKKYFQTSNFAKRDYSEAPVQPEMVLALFGADAETDNSMIIIVSIAATTAVAFAALLIIKKKKHN